MAGELAIDLKDVRKAYGSGAAKTQVLKGVSLQIEPGAFVALVGQSGSGKSTLLNIIGALDLVDAGDVTVLDHVYRGASDKALAHIRNTQIGFVFQHFNLLDHMDCLANVAIPASFDHDAKPEEVENRAMEALERVGLTDLARRRPSELSGGQKQRVAIARALFNRPAILLCDEPTGNLDSETGRDVIEFFKQINRDDGTTLLIVTHEERVSREASRILRILDGALVEGDDSTVARDDSASEDEEGAA